MAAQQVLVTATLLGPFRPLKATSMPERALKTTSRRTSEGLWRRKLPEAAVFLPMGAILRPTEVETTGFPHRDRAVVVLPAEAATTPMSLMAHREAVATR